MENETLSTSPEEFDIGSLIPSLDGLLSKLETLMRVLVMLGPLVILGLGLYYFLMPPKEANHRAGYRFRYGMARVGVWRFMQRVAGIVYALLGLVLTIVMAIQCVGLGSMAAPDMVVHAGKCILWQIVLAAVASLVINLTVVICYDIKGNKRSDIRAAFAAELAAEMEAEAAMEAENEENEEDHTNPES